MESEQVSVEELKKVFDGFDTDKSGFIDVKEIAALAQKLAEPLNEEALTESLRIIDINGDGKVQFKEFELWWKHGRKGPLASLVKHQLNFLKAINAAKGNFKSLGISLQLQQKEIESDKHQVLFTYGKFAQKPDIGIEGKFYLKGKKLENLLSRFQAVLPDYNRKNIGVLMSCQTQDPQNIKTLIQSIYKKLSQQNGQDMHQVIKYKFQTKDKDTYAYFQFHSEYQQMFGGLIQSQALSQLRGIVENNAYNLFANLQISTKIDVALQGILKKRKFDLTFLKAFQFHYLLQTNSFASKAFLNFLYQKDAKALFFLAFLKNLQFKMNFKDESEIRRLIKVLSALDENKNYSKDLEQFFQSILEGWDQILQDHFKQFIQIKKLHQIIKKLRHVELYVVTDIVAAGCEVFFPQGEKQAENFFGLS